jgi:hypothetical protein
MADPLAEHRIRDIAAHINTIMVTVLKPVV